MIDKIRYPGFFATMCFMKIQILQSLDYADQFLPSKISPEDLFYLLKSNITYVPDPPKTELFQTMQTMFEDNFHGIRGGGDCDDFVITQCSCCIVRNIPCDIVLAGRSKRQPVHIYTLQGNSMKPADLTETYYGEERFYPLKQFVQVDL